MKKPLVIITGASSGIGKATAIAFSKEGYPLLLIARRKELLEQLQLPEAICAQVDVTDFESLNKAIKAAEAQYGPADLLINNAGIMPLDKIYDQPLTDQYNLVDINIKGVLNGIHAVVNGMKERRHGTIINVSSVAGRYTFANHSVYCGTKYAVHAISEEIRKELGPFNVRVSVLAPAIVDTNLLTSVKNADILASYQATKKAIDNGLKAEDLAAMMLYLYQLPQRIAIKELVTSATNDLC
ncbi:SDR family oxidoreductase [Spiroplasma chrysopicola]|uniref:Short-chain dehydrogenase/reductase SDR n=1 Tax=Spiroplasma chrysopicola DF-1 TaxID=1276227 RepID=R4U3L7_9MOLU|nr:SDR family oxidoreductase [Spiroplasma chrysopicola]AGM25098.1 short-chain dehydrogenase/reductase SDR [Spiroplasma chrysopicola DF-1]